MKSNERWFMLSSVGASRFKALRNETGLSEKILRPTLKELMAEKKVVEDRPGGFNSEGFKKGYIYSIDEVEKHRIKTTTAHLVGAGLDISKESTLSICPCCNRATDDIKKRRLNTAYVNEEQNWLESCLDCFKGAVENYQDLWDSYYSDCL